jgi:hypothetical protein
MPGGGVENLLDAAAHTRAAAGGTMRKHLAAAFEGLLMWTLVTSPRCSGRCAASASTGCSVGRSRDCAISCWRCSSVDRPSGLETGDGARSRCGDREHEPGPRARPGEVDEAELYAALDWLGERQAASRRRLPSGISGTACSCSTT